MLPTLFSLLLVSNFPNLALADRDDSGYSFTILTSNSTVRKPFKLAILLLLNGNYYYKPRIPSPYRPPGVAEYEQSFLEPWFRRLEYAWPSNQQSRTCLLNGLQMLIDKVNSRQDILPDYELEIHTFTGDIADTLQGQLFVEFFSQPKLEGRRVLSPIFVGPSAWICGPVDLVTKIGLFRIMKHFNVDNIYAEYCNDKGTSSYFASKQSRSDDDILIKRVAAMSFFKSGFVKWRQAGIIVDGYLISGDSIGVVAYFTKMLQPNGIEIVSFEVGTDYRAMFQSVKATRARVILLPSAYITCDECFEIWCESHRVKVTAPKYVFLFGDNRCIPCASSKQGMFRNILGSVDSGLLARCASSIIVEQSRITMFVSAPWLSFDANRKQFNDLASGYFQQIGLNNSVLSAALSQVGCASSFGNRWLNEGMLATIVALNLTENVLKTKLNATFANMRDNEILSQIVTNTAGDLELWEAPNFNERYNDTHNCIVSQAHVIGNETNSTVLVKINPYIPGKQQVDRNFSNHRYEVWNQPVWLTPNGLAPKDLSVVEHRIGSRNDIAFASISSAAAVLSLLQFGLVIAALISKKPTRSGNESYFDYSNNFILIGGCFVLNLSSIIFDTGQNYVFDSFCQWRPLLIVIGFTIINGMLLARMVAMPAFAHENRYITRKARPSNLFSLEFHEEQRQKRVILEVKKIKRFVGAIFTASLLAMFLWFTSDPMVLKMKTHYVDDPLFDTEVDTYYDVLVEWCESTSQVYWISAFVVAHGVMLGIACFHAVTHKRRYKFIRERFRSELNRIRRAVFNCIVLFISIILVMLILSTLKIEYNYLQTAAFAAGEIMYSATNSAIVFYQFFAPSSWRIKPSVTRRTN